MTEKEHLKSILKEYNEEIAKTIKNINKCSNDLKILEQDREIIINYLLLNI